MPTNPNAKLFNEWGAFAVIPHEFIDASTAYSDQAFRLFVLLMRYTNGKTGEAFPSYTHLQSLTGWSTKTIAKAIRELEAAGWIVRKKQFSGPTHYTLVRPHSFPTESTDSTSPGKGMHFPTERTVLSQGKPKKNEIKYIESKKIEREEAAHSRLPALDQPELIHVEPNAVSVLLEVFPQTPIYSQEVIDAADIRDLTLWRQVLCDWRDNRYSTRNVTGMRDRYKSQLAKQEEQNGQNRTRQNNGRPTQLDAARAYNARMQAALERRAARSAGAGDSADQNGEQSADLV